METKNSVQVSIDQDLWVIHVSKCLRIEEEVEKEFCMCVFNVPKTLLLARPEAYIPQCVSIGPYHHWRPELYEMERYKLAAARRFQRRITGQKFECVVEEITKYELQIRSCYHKYLDYKEATLAWLMSLDSVFVLECLQFYIQQADETSSEFPSQVQQLGKVLDHTDRSAAHNAVFKDLMMLENQIPLFLLQKLLKMQLGSEEEAEERLCKLVRLACKVLSPFKFRLPDQTWRHRITKRGHILEALYYSIVPPADPEDGSPEYDEREESSPDRTYVRQALGSLFKCLSSSNIGPIRILTSLGQLLMKIKGPLTFIFGSSTASHAADEEDLDGHSTVEIPPTRNELDIPSVAELHSAGINFCPTHEDLTKIRFDQSTATLHLPKVKLDANTEVILRNLVAYEASAAPGAFIFTRYTDFMNGIIDEEEDVRLLRKSGIIYNHLESDGKVASLWNDMGKCHKLTKVQKLDQVIADVNNYYKRKWNVAVMKYVKKYIFGSWQFLSVLAGIILILLTCLQAFCSVYNCKKWWSDTNFLEY